MQVKKRESKAVNRSKSPQAQGQLTDLALHTLGWKAFQDLCSQIFDDILKTPVSVYRDAQDGGQDAVFIFSQQKGVAKRGTVQCKFTSDVTKKLKAGDITQEKVKIEKLVKSGDADTYYFITNMGIDAPVAIEIRNKLQSWGVNNPEVFGKDYIVKCIRESSRLRALVPRVYGLGDLSIILDERCAEQTRALLGHLTPSLRAYVPTYSHRKAVNIIKENGIVLLLGAPATGKTMIATILATAAVNDGHKCFYLDSPEELSTRWNPNESNCFYWIDDAFGANQLREDYVEQWISMMNKVKTAVSKGNRFVITSRTHIWNSAKEKLGTKNHPLLNSGKAVVAVGDLSHEERGQILYNHIKIGNQSMKWKKSIKTHLTEIAKDARLLPEIARRLGDSSFTGGIKSLPTDLNRFVSEPTVFLKEIIKELNETQQAALILVFLYRSKLPLDVSSCPLSEIVCDKYKTNIADIGSALQHLESTFVVKKLDSNIKKWSFIHPTISDALSSILGDRPELTDIYLRGVKVETILSNALCEGMPTIQDVVIIKKLLDDVLIERLLETEDEVSLNNKLFEFLNRRASDYVFRKVISRKISILERNYYNFCSISNDSKINLFSRAHKLQILPEELRNEAIDRLEYAILKDQNSRIFDCEDILCLIRPIQLIKITIQLTSQIQDTLSEEVENVESNVDLEYEPEENFDELNEYIDGMGVLFSDHEGVTESIASAKDEIKEAISRIAEEKLNSRNSSKEWVGEDVVPAKVGDLPLVSRSLFSDIDE